MCGIFGIAGHKEASNLTYLGLYALQHRGQEAAGIVSTDGERTYHVRRRHLVSDTFDRKTLETLKGDVAIGHVRYSTSGDNNFRNVQPFSAQGAFGSLSVAHNGNLTNFSSLRSKLQEKGAIFQSTMDTEVILHVVGQSKGDTLEEKIVEGLKQLQGAYSLLFLTEKEMIAVRDPMGFRPLSVAKLDGAPVISSETCAFDLIGAQYEREIEPGQIWIWRRGQKPVIKTFEPSKRRAACVFEHIYFARPDSMLFGKSVYDVRYRLGRELAKEHKIEADLVMPVPDSGVVTAMGYSDESRIPLQMGLIRNHYVGRTFIEPKQSIRGFGVKVKLNPVKSVLKGKRVVVIDDSIVRGTTSKKIVKMIRDSGAQEITMLISSPPVISPCHYGIDTPNKDELIAANKSVDEIRKFIGADRLGYLSLEGVYRALEEDRNTYCDACFSNRYLTPLDPALQGLEAKGRRA
jgi:amidophosphoribosyltransferase